MMKAVFAVMTLMLLVTPLWSKERANETVVPTLVIKPLVQDGKSTLVVSFGIKNLSPADIIFMYSGWTNCLLECKDVKDESTPLTKLGRQVQSAFNPHESSRRRVDDILVRRGADFWIISNFAIKSLFKIKKGRRYFMRVTVEESLPGKSSRSAVFWNGKAVSSWVPFES